MAASSGAGRISPTSRPRQLVSVAPGPRSRDGGIVARDEMHQGGLGGALGAVVDLEREAEAVLGERAAVDALGAALHEHLARQALHDLRDEGAGAGDEIGVGPARLAMRAAVAACCAAKPRPVAEPRKGVRQPR